MDIKHPRLAALSCCAIAISSVSAGAAEPAYNPDNLNSEQISRVSHICQSVMGLSPEEALSGGYWIGTDRLESFTSKYRGCIVSLSDSLKKVTDEQVTQEADANCRAKGFETDSPDLALCVLRSVNSRVALAPSRASSAAATPLSEKLPVASGSYAYASPHEIVRREQVACAGLGFEPSYGDFKSCVRGLSDTFYAIDHPIN